MIEAVIVTEHVATGAVCGLTEVVVMMLLGAIGMRVPFDAIGGLVRVDATLMGVSRVRVAVEVMVIWGSRRVTVVCHVCYVWTRCFPGRCSYVGPLN